MGVAGAVNHREIKNNNYKIKKAVLLLVVFVLLIR